MRKIVCTLVVLLIATVAGVAQTQKAVKTLFPGGKSYLYRLTLVDKKGTPYKVTKPQEFLSQKAIERRKRQGLAVDETDLSLSPKYLKEIRKTGVEIIGCSKWNNTVLVHGKDSTMMEGLTSLPCVTEVKKVWVSPDSTTLQTRETILPNLVTEEIKGKSHHGVADYQITLLNGKQLHEAGFRGEGMTMAVIDGGFMNADRIEVLQNVRILGTHDFSFPRAENIFQEPDHGTQVLSCIATNLPETFVGTAPGADFWLLRTEDTLIESLAEEDFWAMAVEFADSVGVDVINSSLGYAYFDDPTMNHLYREQDGRTALNSRTASKIASKGMVLVNSAGNFGSGTWKKINFPADATDILAVGALRPDKVNAVFSSIGPTADGRVKPDVMSLGAPAQVINGQGVIKRSNGTSFAAPILAGMVTCLWQALPNKTAQEIVEIVRRSGNNYTTPDNIFGYGIPDFWKAYETNK